MREVELFFFLFIRFGLLLRFFCCDSHHAGTVHVPISTENGSKKVNEHKSIIEHIIMLLSSDKTNSDSCCQS